MFFVATFADEYTEMMSFIEVSTIEQTEKQSIRLMKIAVFCSANDNIDAGYFKMTEELGQWMGRNGHTLVYGGVDRGLMRCIGQAVHNNGGMTIGVVPQIVAYSGPRPDYLDVEIPCDNLSDRKDMMLNQADISIALPGGIGTLDEVFSVAASHNIGYHAKMVVLYNADGFWDKTVEMLDDMQARGFIRNRWTEYIKVAASIEKLKEMTEE